MVSFNNWGIIETVLIILKIKKPLGIRPMRWFLAPLYPKHKQALSNSYTYLMVGINSSTKVDYTYRTR